MAPCYTEYLKLESLRNCQRQKGHSDLPSSLQQVIKSPCERCPSYSNEEVRHSYHQRQGIGGQNICTIKPWKTNPYLPSYFFTLLHRALIHLSCQFFTHWLFLCLKGIKASCFGSSFSFKGPHVYVKIKKKIVSFFLTVCLISV